MLISTGFSFKDSGDDKSYERASTINVLVMYMRAGGLEAYDLCDIVVT